MNITLSQKERMLLEDQKTHEQLCIEKYTNYASETQDPQLKQIFNANCNAEKEHLNSINQLLNGQIPDMNNKQNQNSNKSMGNQGSTPNTQGIQPILSDAEMCKDILMTEKYVSGAYNTTIFECRDTNVRDVLNHIQTEEQKHGESVFKYMESHGMYNVQ